MTNPTLRHQGGPVSDLDRLIEHLERTARDMRLRAEGIESALTQARSFRLASTFPDTQQQEDHHLSDDPRELWQAHTKHSLMRRVMGEPTEFQCACGETLTAPTYFATQVAWERHRWERLNAALRHRRKEDQ